MGRERQQVPGSCLDAHKTGGREEVAAQDLTVMGRPAPLRLGTFPQNVDP